LKNSFIWRVEIVFDLCAEIIHAPGKA